MDKRREIPAAKPNAAPRADVERVGQRISTLGLTWHEAVEQAGLSRSTAYRFLNFTASVASLRELEEWVVKEEARRRLPQQPTGEEQDAQLAEWAEIGRELAKSDPARFAATLDGLRDVLASVKLTERAFHKMFRATPENER